tara:strand:+ start:2312 stop:2893 length:582 start_codon:yes stop_codon:yes gene_type:complete
MVEPKKVVFVPETVSTIFNALDGKVNDWLGKKITPKQELALKMVEEAFQGLTTDKEKIDAISGIGTLGLPSEVKAAIKNAQSQKNIAEDTTMEDKKAANKGTSTVRDVRGTKPVTPPKEKTDIAKDTTMEDKKAARKSEMRRYGAEERERIRRKAEEENIDEAAAEQNLRKGGPTKKVYGMRHGGFTKRGPMS